MSEESAMLWVPDQEQLWLPAQLVRRDAGSFMVRYLDGREVHLLGDPDTFQRVTPGSIEAEVDDLAQLEDVNEGIVYYVLRKRFDRGDLYTFAGDVLLLMCTHTADAPPFPSLRSCIDSLRGGCDQRPHLTTLAARAYVAMCAEQSPQTLLLLGISGSGKTTAARQLMTGFTELAENDMISQQLRAFLSVTRVFGHARAGRNQRSSRYAGWTSVAFSSAGASQGFHFQLFNLDKSRVVQQAAGDSNFLVFYMLLAGMDEELRRLTHIRTSNPAAYACLSHGGPPPSQEDSDQGFSDICTALAAIDIDEAQQRDVFSVLVGILHLCNIMFEDDGDKGCKTVDAQQVAVAAQALRVDSVQLDSALRFRETVMDRNDKYLVELDKRRTIEQRDAMAKELYSKLLDWLMSRVNSSSGQPINTDSPTTISILDMCGFQNAEAASFDHLCVNYWNEKVHQFFTDRTVTSHVETYKAEGLPWNHPDIGGPNLCVELFESKGGLLSMLEEEASLPRGSDAKLVSRFHSAFAESGPHKSYSRSRRKNEMFVIRHFSEDVSYSIDGFVDKAKDAVPPQIGPLLAASGNSLLQAWFAGADGQGGEPGRKSKKNALRVKSEVQHVVSTLGKTKPHFVLCLKTNPRLSPSVFDGQTVVNQFNAAGMYDQILNKQHGWGLRLSHDEFVNRYIVCLPSVRRPDADNVASKVTEIMEIMAPRLSIPPTAWAMGASTVCFRSAQLLVGAADLVEAGKLRLLVRLQSMLRAMLGRRIAREKREEKLLIAQAEQARLNRENNAMRAEDELMQAIIESEKVALRLKKEKEERLEHERLERLAAEAALRQKSATQIQSFMRGNRDRAKFVVYSAVIRLQQAMQSTDQGRLSAAIHDANVVKAKYPTVMITRMLQETNQILKRARQIRQTREQLADAIVQQALDSLRRALAECEEKDCMELPEYSLASQHLQRLEAKQRLIGYLDFLARNAHTPAALLSSCDEIDSVLAQVQSMGLSEHPTVANMRRRLMRIERLRVLRDDLREACEIVSQRDIEAALDRLKPSVLLHGEQLCATEVAAASHILKMLDLEHKVREARPSNTDSADDDGGGGSYEHDEYDDSMNDADTHDDSRPRLPIRVRRRLDLLQRATTEAERQYATKVLQTECPNPRLLVRYKRAHKWVVGFCTWNYKNSSTASASATMRTTTADSSACAAPSLRLPQREEQPLLGSLRTLWTQSTLKVQEMDFETLYQEFTSASNFEQKQGTPLADQLISDAVEAFKAFESKRPYRPAFK